MVASDERRAGRTHAAEEKPSAGTRASCAAWPSAVASDDARSAPGQRRPHLLQQAAEQGGVAALPVHRHGLLALARRHLACGKGTRSTASRPRALSRGVRTGRGPTGPGRMARAHVPASHEELRPGCTGPWPEPGGTGGGLDSRSRTGGSSADAPHGPQPDAEHAGHGGGRLRGLTDAGPEVLRPEPISTLRRPDEARSRHIHNARGTVPSNGDTKKE